MTAYPPGRLPRLAAATIRLTGWRRRGLAFGLGLLSATALPPLHLVFLLLASIPGLIWLLDGSQNRRAAFGAGWWWGFGHFAAGLYWISNALLVDAAKFAWMIPFSIFGLGAFLALFMGAVTLAVHLTGRSGWRRLLLLAPAWTFQEWVRSWILTGFPWNLMGTVWVFSDAMIQSAALWGTFGLSFATIALAGLPALAAEGGMRCSRNALVAGLAMLAILWSGGALRLIDATSQTVPGVTLRLVQAATPQADKWRADQRARHLFDHVELSRGPGFEAITHLVWSETAIPFILDHDPDAREVVARAVPPGGLVLTGVPRSTPPGVEPFTVWNSLQAVDERGEIVGSYDKVHLVPFGEYVPLRQWIKLAKITAGTTDFTPGPGATTMTLPGLPPFSPLICYEVIFPGKIVAEDARPAWLLNVTNDGWFGLSAGPYQHFATARMRAVEEGLPLVRAANTGISAIVDGHGRVTAMLALGERGVVDGALPIELSPTPYGRFGDAIPILLLLVAIFAALRQGSRLSGVN